MHKGVILLTKANDADEARGNVHSFMEGYGEGNVWDWYVIGGRWSGWLNPITSKFEEQAKKEVFDPIKEKSDCNFISQQNIDDNAERLQALWLVLGGKEKNTFDRDNYNDDGAPDDVVLADNPDVKEILLKNVNDKEKEADEVWEKMLEAKKEKGTMSAYYAGIYKNASYDSFSFETTVFDCDDFTHEIPDDLAGYYAVVIDMHN